MRLRYPATAEGEVQGEEFRCTTSALGLHDDILECPRCGLLSSRPTLRPEEVIHGYEEVVDEEYLLEEQERRGLFRWIAGRISDYPVRGRRLFEVGANVGLFLAVAEEFGWEPSGIEPSGWAVGEGRGRFGVQLEQGTVESLDLPSASVDVLVMLDVLEHLHDPSAALSRIRDSMDEEGLLALSTVNVESVHGRFRGGRWPWFIRSHLHYFRPATLCAMLARAGFEVVEWDVVPRSFHLSYLVERAGDTLPGSKVAEAISRRIDPEIPVGWIGDVTLVLARPTTPSPPD
jgi:2-polyprenyl-3-methyl-5-hydroxy-6-metoxy-1,4-benzoquinol methylase